MAELYTKQTPQLLIEAWINQLMIYLGGASIEAYQITEMAEYLYEDNKMLSLAELTLFFTRVKKGLYGQLYGRINPLDILRWSKEYRKERGVFVTKNY